MINENEKARVIEQDAPLPFDFNLIHSSFVHTNEGVSLILSSFFLSIFQGPTLSNNLGYGSYNTAKSGSGQNLVKGLGDGNPETEGIPKMGR